MYKYIKDQLEEVKLRIAQVAKKNGRDESDIKLVAVSKTFPVEAIVEAYNTGQRIFGENKVQELVHKVPQLPDDIQWHHIGHLQGNKAASAVELSTVIEAVDSIKLLNKVNRLASDRDIVQKILLEINISGEESKFGEGEVASVALASLALELPNIELLGLMTMAPFGVDECELRKVFSGLRELRNSIEKRFDAKLPELSMGMSSDYEIAIEEGSTMVRIGTAIFGKRN